ncbi:hypothetical protein PISMIDRAFT_29909 [Pisolithus microcarpus 441]|uniref:Amidase domain-containing protein n=1 Tax=Pisolithus microcarpus 441 TaxID=765257 RepID=A0A0C9Y9S6_9AGAM|nr:hypothetical protein PISMIDRAFT_29909 [Pisolithus microcarpus 441]
MRMLTRLFYYISAYLRVHLTTHSLQPAVPRKWARPATRSGSLAGVPVSLNDSSLGYPVFTNAPVPNDAPIVRLHHDVGAIPYVKTNVPLTLYSYETTNDVFGVTENPHKQSYSPGGSSGGESDPLTFWSSRVGIGTRCTATVPGQGVDGIQSPMAKTLDDFETLWRAVVSLSWKEVHLPLDRPIRWGVLWDDGVVAPSPTCLRALKTAGRNSPRPYEGLQIASQLLFAGRSKLFSEAFHTFETKPLGIAPALCALTLPRFVMKIYAWYLRYIRRDPVYAGLVENFHEKTIQESRGSSGDNGVDFILTIPNTLPAVPHGGMRHGWKACGYAGLFNVLDYSAGVMPITRINKIGDKLPPWFRARNAIERSNHRIYNSEAMDGLPVGVQVVGRRLDEERDLEGMKLIHGLMADAGLTYQGIPL